MNAGWKQFALAALVAGMPALASAQSATVNGSLGNFDVINNVGQNVHGFEIQLDGVGQNDIAYAFGGNRYGSPTYIQNAAGVAVRWSGTWNSSMQQFLQTTIPYAGGGAFGGTCYMWGATYDTAGCEHFGVTLRANATRTTYRWLVADPQNVGSLLAVDPGTPVAAPVYYILPPAPTQPAPVLVAEVAAPEPAQAPELFGDAEWMKVFKTQLNRQVGLDELMSDNPTVVPESAAQVETEWTLIQTEPATSGGQFHRGKKLNQTALDAQTQSVVRRYELYAYTGPYDPVTHQALCADLACNAPSLGELGDFISAQMSAANVTVPSITVSRTGNGQVVSSDKLINCGTACVQLYNQGANVTLNAAAGSGSVFTGWTGACAGFGSTCSLLVNQNFATAATFKLVFNLSVGKSNKGTVSSDDGSISCGTVNSKGISACSAKFVDGTLVTLTATPPAGASFLGWGGACSGTSPICQIVIAKDTSVQANFSK